ncbi:MAG: lipase family protein, partial [Gemmatimonadales bacterium]
VQSRCGRVVILSYRGTEPATLGNWLADADVGSASLVLGGEVLGVHSGFYRNLRATQWEVINELQLALRGRSLSDPENALEYPMQALYVTGHSLGGALAVLFSLSVAGHAEQRAIADTLRAVYTFGQPLTVAEPLPEVARAVAQKVFRHVNARDPVPALPPLAWGRLAHFGHEYRFANGEWTASDTPVAQLEGIREIPRALLAFFATAKHRDSSRYAMTDHGPHHYIAELRPKGRVTEFGDQG